MIQNTSRPRGRPRSFDETGALEKATQVFWSKGYDGVTMDDLIEGMEVGRPFRTSYKDEVGSLRSLLPRERSPKPDEEPVIRAAIFWYIVRHLEIGACLGSANTAQIQAFHERGGLRW